MKRNLSMLMMGLASIAIFTSCNHKDLCYMHEHKTKLRVAYDWRDAPDATAKGMCVFFYSEENPEEYYRFDFANTEGGEIELPAGSYRLISYNNDTEIVRFTATNIYEGHEATTRKADLLEPMYGNGVTSTASTDNGEDVMATPDGLWGCHAVDVEVSEHGVSYTIIHYDDTRAEAGSTISVDGDQVITLYPHDMLCHYSYEVRHVDNADKISKVSASLSGMSPSLSLSDETLDATPVTLPVSGKADAATSEITGRFLTFGHNQSNAAKHKMTFYVEMTDGSKYVVKDDDNFDVTNQVDAAPDRRHVHIIIDHLKLPDPTAGDGQGWQPTVDDWGIIKEDIKI